MKKLNLLFILILALTTCFATPVMAKKWTCKIALGQAADLY